MINEKTLIEEIEQQFGSVGKMVALVNNEVSNLKKYHGYEGRDGGDTLQRALTKIPSRFHSIFYKWAYTSPKP